MTKTERPGWHNRCELDTRDFKTNIYLQFSQTLFLTVIIIDVVVVDIDITYPAVDVKRDENAYIADVKKKNMNLSRIPVKTNSNIITVVVKAYHTAVSARVYRLITMTILLRARACVCVC